mgnify:CR=1 FL=1
MNRAIILAGGKGERLRPYTEDKPKAMIPVSGIPILSYQLHWLKEHGITKVAVSCGHFHKVIQDYFGNGKSHQVEIEYFVEDAPLGRGGAIKSVMRKLAPLHEGVVALNGDFITNLNLGELIAFHNTHGAHATVATVPLKCPYGVVEFESEVYIQKFREKPNLPIWINAGVYVFEPAIVEQFPDVGDHESEAFPKLAGTGKLIGYKSNCFWRAIDTVKDINEAGAELQKILVSSLLRNDVESAALS